MLEAGDLVTEYVELAGVLKVMVMMIAVMSMGVVMVREGGEG